jgi:hypothetical protein
MQERRHQGQHGPECFGCRVQSVAIAPSAMPSRRNFNPPHVNESANNWEKGVALHSNGLPFLDDHLDPIGLAEWQETRSTYVPEFQAQLAAKQATAATQE